MKNEDIHIEPSIGVLPALICILVVMLASLMPAHASYPLVRNLHDSNFDNGSQVWDIAQDTIGRVYVAGRFGVAQTDSRKWSYHALANESEVRSLFSDDSTGRIYAGGSNEFGYFSHDSDRHGVTYTSMVDLVPASRRNFHEVWKIFKVRDQIWFQSDRSLFRYNGKSVMTFDSPEKITASGVVDDNLFIGTYNGMLATLRGGKVIPIDAPQLAGQRIVAILPSSVRKSMLVVTEYDGIYSFNGITSEKLSTPIDAFMRDNQVFCAAIDGNVIAIGTVNMGLVVWDMANGELSFANLYTGMQNNTVLSVKFDRFGNIWSGLDNGLDYVVYSSAIHGLLGKSNSYGSGYASHLSGNTLYLGTNQGLYSTPFPMSPTPIPSPLPQIIKGQVWQMAQIEGNLFASSEGGLFIINGNSARRIEGVSGALSAVPLKWHPGYALVSTYTGFVLLKKDGGAWKSLGYVKGYNDIGGRPVQDESGNIWLSHWMKGVYRLRLDVAQRRFSLVSIYDSKKGFPENRYNAATLHNNSVVFSTSRGFYVYDPSSDRMKPLSLLSDLFGSNKSGSLWMSPQRDIWMVNASDGVSVVHPTPTGGYDLDTVSYSSLTRKLIPGSESVEFISPGKIIVSGKGGFYQINPIQNGGDNRRFPLTVSRVTTVGDSLVYDASDKSELVVSYDCNSLRFEAVMPEFREDYAVKYSFMLEDYDKEWSVPSNINVKEYTQLPEGNYTLRVRAENIIDKSSSEVKMSFTVRPPWYRSGIAWTVYALLFIGSGYIAWLFVKRLTKVKAEREMKKNLEDIDKLKRQAEAEKLHQEMEISELKGRQLQQEVKHKSAELSNVIMNLSRKNEVLIDISELLDKLNAYMASSSDSKAVEQHIRKIKTKINDNISHDNDWQKFTHNFDDVYQGFTRRLQELHPTLTRNELKVCCYLRMGLNSKDIAPLFSISPRSVEMTRYRLRKKLELNRDENLVAYLEKI